MSFAIIILTPVPQNARLFDQEQAVAALGSPSSPLKEQKRQDTIIWKKSISAFKKFRHKRERSQLGKDSQIYGNDQQQCEVQKSYVKLVRRSKKDMENDAEIRLPESPKSFCGYFDPNLAPLYQYNLSEALELNEKTMKESCSTKQMEGQYHQIKNQRNQSQIAEEFIPVELVIEPRDDDPFLIIRRQSVAKNSKTFKTKLIKKSQGQKWKAKGPSISLSMKKTERPQQQHNFTNRNLGSSMSKESESLSDSEQECRSQHRIGSKRQIETLQQILRLSQQNQQISQLTQFRETMIKMKESSSEKPKFQLI